MLAPPPQRHSMEISGPVLISSSNPTAAARIGEISGGLSCSAPSQVKSTRVTQSSARIPVQSQPGSCTLVRLFVDVQYVPEYSVQRFLMDKGEESH